MLLDIHSHYAAPIAGESIWNVEPAVFSPIEGNYYSVGIHPWKAGAVREADFVGGSDGKTLDYSLCESL